jgi:antitoxin CptB
MRGGRCISSRPKWLPIADAALYTGGASGLDRRAMRDHVMTGTQRSSADLDPRRRRILFRSWHRGTREMDLLMGRFADARSGGLSGEELDLFEALIEVPDRDLFAWLTDAAPVPENYDTPLYRAVKAFHTHQGPVHV